VAQPGGLNDGIHDVMGSIPISSTSSGNDLGTTQGGQDASQPPLCHVCVTFPAEHRGTPRDTVP